MVEEFRWPVRVGYGDTDQMGVAWHGAYVAWLETARTEYLRTRGFSYRDLEARGVLLTVSAMHLRYRGGARYDECLEVRTWVREVGSRGVSFGYAVEREGGALLVTALTDLIAVDRAFRVIRLPDLLREALTPIPDPVRLGR